MCSIIYLGALKDFDKPAKSAAPKENDGSSTSAVAKPEEAREDCAVEEVWIDDFMKQAAEQFQRNFDDLMHNNGSFNGEYLMLL